jgi:ppGpp synthetase/RelA/SpoT-type nucleotidyltranferase
MAWVEPRFDRAQVNAAGRALVQWDLVESDAPDWLDKYWDYDAALPIINNWRSSHSFPLNTFRMNLSRAAHRVDPECLLAQRIKRLSSISLKLRRFPHMRLTQMQDIGGCRAVVRSVEAVQELADIYRRSDIKHKRDPIDDYIAQPQSTGYRGIHLKFRYHSDKKETYNGLRIEMQLRSQLQHAWATAVETVGTFVQQALKSSMGDDEWLRFFALMGTAVAFREGTPPVPGTHDTKEKLLPELYHYARALDVENRLQAYSEALQILEQPSAADADYYLLKIDPSERQVTVKGFKRFDLEKAEQEYLEVEKSLSKQQADAVLVSVESLASLRRAYPNYFADTGLFADMLKQSLRGFQPNLIH